jgi:dehydrogenase/reductase SDR family protein 12
MNICQSLTLPPLSLEVSFSFRALFCSVRAMGNQMGGGGGGYSVIALGQWYAEGLRSYGRAGCSHLPPLQHTSKEMEGQHVIVTGGNSGLGFSAAQMLARRGCTLHLISRSQDRGDAAIKELKASNPRFQDNLHLHILDVGEFGACRQFAASFNENFGQLSVLINNAGGMPSEKQFTSEGNECINACMLGGTHLLTSLLLPSLKASALQRGKPSRVINVSSAGMLTVRANPDDLNGERRKKYDGALQYALAKRHQVCLTEMWARKLQEEAIPVSVCSMHPGWCDTPGLREGMPSFHAHYISSLRPPEDGCDTILWLAASQLDAAEQSGKFFFDRKAVRTHLRAAGTQSADNEYQRLWENAVLLTGADFP